MRKLQFSRFGLLPVIREDHAHKDGEGQGRKVKRISDNKVLIKTSVDGSGRELIHQSCRTMLRHIHLS